MIEIIFLDVDGCLTDGGLYYTNLGDELKKFNVNDGFGIEQWNKMGKISAIITGKSSKIVEKRAKDLSIYTLVALFPLASVLFAISLGIVTYRYEKGFVYVGVFGVLFVYFASIMLLAKKPLIAIPVVFSLFFITSLFAFYQKISKKYWWK